MSCTPRTCALPLLLTFNLAVAGLQAQEGRPDDGSPAAEARPTAPWPAKKWPRSLPDKQGLDGAALNQLVELIEAGEEFPDLHGLLGVRHGYWWWILPPAEDRGDEQDIYAACGFMAQYILVIPEHDLIVVVTGGTENHEDMVKPIRMLYSHVLPTVR